MPRSAFLFKWREVYLKNSFPRETFLLNRRLSYDCYRPIYYNSIDRRRRYNAIARRFVTADFNRVDGLSSDGSK